MTNILPFPTSFHGAGLNERFGGVSARADGPAPSNGAGGVTEAGGVRDDVSIKAGAQVTTNVVGRVQAADGLREASSFLQVADAGVAWIDGKLGEVRALAEVAATAAMGMFERVVLNDAFKELMGESDQIARETEFNGKNPLAGFHQDVDLGNGEILSISLPSVVMSDIAPELAGDDLLSQENSLKTIVDIDEARERIADIREDIASMLAVISVALKGGGGSMALDTIQSYGDFIDEGADLARAISREVVLEALLPAERSDRNGGLTDRNVPPPEKP